ncbi:MliC family protein [Psychrobacter sp. DM4]|uniref:MliC family protein n=1 Tax=Psychrobacter sp. DM4 TaxID=3440637 RepID=UPI003F4F97F6
MKKLLIISPFSVLLAACATSAPTPSTSTSTSTAQPVVQSFICQDDSAIVATYSADGQMADLTITLPKVGLNNAAVRTERAVSGSSARYVNDVNPATTYEWQTRADYGIMTIKSNNGQQYQVNCQL